MGLCLFFLTMATNCLTLGKSLFHQETQCLHLQNALKTKIFTHGDSIMELRGYHRVSVEYILFPFPPSTEQMHEFILFSLQPSDVDRSSLPFKIKLQKMVTQVWDGELTGKDQQGTFWGEGSVLNLVLRGVYTVVYSCQISLNTSEVCILVYVNYVSIF